jgi:hypothetical protein
MNATEQAPKLSSADLPPGLIEPVFPPADCPVDQDQIDAVLTSIRATIKAWSPGWRATIRRWTDAIEARHGCPRWAAGWEAYACAVPLVEAGESPPTREESAS